ncbi:DUF5994 family protein [Pseudonocardia humida]|uniref:Uncharacterized protein n=1 Tax=Pseudonocardia humida TaxID=2800819 RepID=A0ABT0ZTL9_9PSEU|nr:DUF5994 family protein [Pseudonocardia humida]MCO1654029.1 hypothetical protein [Pseudonocardia humida]
MTPDSSTTDLAAPPSPTDSDRPRLKLKPRTPDPTGFFDGGWWPRSRDLVAEVPALLAVLGVRLGRVERVGYRISDWDPTPRRIVVDGGTVHLSGYLQRPARTLDVIGRLHRVTLLVVPAETDPDLAHRALTAAGHRENADDVATLLAAPAAPIR